MNKRPRPDLVDECPACGISFQTPPRESVDIKGGKVVYNTTPVMASDKGLACMNCGVTEGREVVQEGYTENSLFNSTKHPPVYGSRIWVFRRSQKRDAK